MRVYTVHTRPLSAAPDREAVLVRDGFNWAAALFSVLWALFNGLWLIAPLILIVSAALEFVLTFAGADPTTKLAVDIAFLAVVGYEANGWRRAALERQGYRTVGVAVAQDRDSALRRFVDLNPEVFSDRGGAHAS